MSSKTPLLPCVSYSSPDLRKEFTVSPEDATTTDSVTSGPSEHVVGSVGNYVDKNKPSEHRDTEVGRLRAYITNLQDQVNVFLTARMKEEKAKEKAEKAEKAGK